MHDPQEKEKLVSRLKSVAGHVKGIARMVDEDAYCIDVIQQVQAVQAALNKVSLLVLDDHLHHCVTEAIRSEDPGERQRVLAEIRDVFETKSKL
ncbi:MAG: metal-sensitive transcriptional regulator [Chloroflexi bacterium]|nr:metal-sensitive transcriptional regulator [Chloroflexota bacterium]